MSTPPKKMKQLSASARSYQRARANLLQPQSQIFSHTFFRNFTIFKLRSTTEQMPALVYQK
jgi:hypothetical protein